MTEAAPALLTARFDPKLRVYVYLRGLFYLVITIIGIPVIPFWLVLGWTWAGRYYESLRCELDERRLRFHRGVLFRKNKTIPLDRIQDFTLHHGPVHRALGICALRIETAGQASAQGRADAELLGLIDAEEFQERVLAQRDRIMEALPGSAGAQRQLPPAGDPVLVEIRDLLQRIEQSVRVPQS